MTDNWVEKYGSWALVTGAAQGIGKEFSRQCAIRGLSVVMVDRDAVELKQTAAELSDEFPVQIWPLELDLSSSDFIDELKQETRDIEIGVLVNNAAMATVGPFLQLPEASMLTQNRVNIITPLLLIQHFATAMVERGRGAIINVSSRTGETGTPYFSTYGASKAFLTNYSEALWFELKEQGVDVFTLKPDQTATPGFLKHAPRDYAAGVQATEDCVAEAFEWTGKCIGRIPTASGREADAAMKAMAREEAIALIGDGMKQIFSETLG